MLYSEVKSVTEAENVGVSHAQNSQSSDRKTLSTVELYVFKMKYTNQKIYNNSAAEK